MSKESESARGEFRCQRGIPVRNQKNPPLGWIFLERVTGIEPALKAWEALILPLNYTRLKLGLYVLSFYL